MPIAMTFYPNETWLTQLRPGNHVYLVKEGRFAHVEWPWEPPMNEFGTGRIGLRFEGGRRDTWGLRANGQGNDGSQCLMPVEGELLANPDPLPEPEIRQLQRRMAAVEERSHRQWEQFNRQELMLSNMTRRLLHLERQLTAAGHIPPPEPQVADAELVLASMSSVTRVDTGYAGMIRERASTDAEILGLPAEPQSRPPIRVSIARTGLPPSEASISRVVGEITGFSIPDRKIADLVQISPERTSRFDRIDEE